MLNRAGYGLLASTKVNDAVEVLKLNVRLFPNSSNVYDSLGEAYAAAGESRLAIENSEKSIAHNPNSEGGKLAFREPRVDQRAIPLPRSASSRKECDDAFEEYDIDHTQRFDPGEFSKYQSRLQDITDETDVTFDDAVCAAAFSDAPVEGRRVRLGTVEDVLVRRRRR
jgi:tetratricopeptide (TPR) repeat protein